MTPVFFFPFVLERANAFQKKNNFDPMMIVRKPDASCSPSSSSPRIVVVVIIRRTKETARAAAATTWRRFAGSAVVSIDEGSIETKRFFKDE